MKLSHEANIGILVVVTLGILGGLTWKTGNFDFSTKTYEIKVQFKDIEGVEENSPVTVNGLDVGRVKGIQILYGEVTRVELTLWLKSNAKLRQGSTARVKNMGFLGEKYVALTTGDDGADFLPPGALIIGEEPTSFENILAQGEDIAINIKEISQSLNERLKVNSESIDKIVANLDTSMVHIASISGNIDERLEVNKQQIDGFVLKLSQASNNLEELSLDLKENPWKLLYKPKRKQ